MTSSVAKVIDQELAQFGYSEPDATNSINQFKPLKIDQLVVNEEKEKFDLIDIFICHIIFYGILCVSLFLYVAFDLGLGYYLKNKLNDLIRFGIITVEKLKLSRSQ